MNSIQDDISKGQQSINLSRIVEVGGFRIRISIKSDSYDFQSYAYSEVWSQSELKWNKVVSIHHGEMKTPHKLYYKPNNGGTNPDHFSDDADYLLGATMQVLGV